MPVNFHSDLGALLKSTGPSGDSVHTSWCELKASLRALRGNVRESEIGDPWKLLSRPANKVGQNGSWGRVILIGTSREIMQVLAIVLMMPKREQMDQRPLGKD